MTTKITILMNRLLVTVLFATIVPSTVLAACFLPGAAQISAGTKWASGPNVYAAAVANPSVGTEILAAQDAWDVTDAANRLAGWNGVVTASDCPAGQPSQVGAFDFNTVSCATVSAYFPNGVSTVLAFVDYFPSVCATCGTKSLSVNLAFAWAVGTPLAGQYHLRSVLAHEFGHVLGLAHMSGGACVNSSPSCAASPGRETMGGTFYPGSVETCEANVAPNDVSSANALY